MILQVLFLLGVITSADWHGALVPFLLALAVVASVVGVCTDSFVARWAAVALAGGAIVGGTVGSEPHWAEATAFTLWILHRTVWPSQAKRLAALVFLPALVLLFATPHGLLWFVGTIASSVAAPAILMRGQGLPREHAFSVRVLGLALLGMVAASVLVYLQPGTGGLVTGSVVAALVLWVGRLIIWRERAKRGGMMWRRSIRATSAGWVVIVALALTTVVASVRSTVESYWLAVQLGLLIVLSGVLRSTRKPQDPATYPFGWFREGGPLS